MNVRQSHRCVIKNSRGFLNAVSKRQKTTASNSRDRSPTVIIYQTFFVGIVAHTSRTCAERVLHTNVAKLIKILKLWTFSLSEGLKVKSECGFFNFLTALKRRDTVFSWIQFLVKRRTFSQTNLPC